MQPKRKFEGNNNFTPQKRQTYVLSQLSPRSTRNLTELFLTPGVGSSVLEFCRPLDLISLQQCSHNLNMNLPSQVTSLMISGCTSLDLDNWTRFRNVRSLTLLNCSFRMKGERIFQRVYDLCALFPHLQQFILKQEEGCKFYERMVLHISRPLRQVSIQADLLYRIVPIYTTSIIREDTFSNGLSLHSDQLETLESSLFPHHVQSVYVQNYGQKVYDLNKLNQAFSETTSIDINVDAQAREVPSVLNFTKLTNLHDFSFYCHAAPRVFLPRTISSLIWHNPYSSSICFSDPQDQIVSTTQQLETSSIKLTGHYPNLKILSFPYKTCSPIIIELDKTTQLPQLEKITAHKIIHFRSLLHSTKLKSVNLIGCQSRGILQSEEFHQLLQLPSLDTLDLGHLLCSHAKLDIVRSNIRCLHIAFICDENDQDEIPLQLTIQHCSRLETVQFNRVAIASLTLANLPCLKKMCLDISNSVIRAKLLNGTAGFQMDQQLRQYMEAHRIPDLGSLF